MENYFFVKLDYPIGNALDNMQCLQMSLISHSGSTKTNFNYFTTKIKIKKILKDTCRLSTRTNILSSLKLHDKHIH